MLETLRLFALERLVEHCEIDAARKAHSEYSMEAAEAARDLMGISIAAGLRQIDLERDNILLAMSWARADDDGTVGLRLAVAMRLYWTSRGLVPKGLELMRAALAHPGLRTASRHRCEIEIRAATFSSMLGWYQDALNHALNAVSLARELGDDALLSSSLAEVGVAHLSRKEFSDAMRVGLEATAVARRVGLPGPLIYALSRIAAVYMHREQFALARELEEEVLSISQREGDPRNQVVAHLNLAVIAIEMDDLPDARPHLEAVRVLLPKVDSMFLGASLIRIMAGWAAAHGRSVAALSLYAAHAAHSQQAGVSVNLERFESARLQAARLALDSSRVDDAEKAGRAWSYQDALLYATDLLDGHRLDGQQRP
jgi:tetratricopeptide (TPR) repeat protein